MSDQIAVIKRGPYTRSHFHREHDWSTEHFASEYLTNTFQASFSPESLAGCPVMGKKLSKEGCDSEGINPLNNMPIALSSEKLPGQKIELPTQKTMSTIPKGTDGKEGVWEYPSPQQMFNAMIRKGKGNVPEDAVESMVSIHNFLNEGAWGEILEWEDRHTKASKVEPRLERFTGIPDKMSPRAKIFTTLGKYFPNRFNATPPFDRHDWTVMRGDGKGGWRKVRYVIDYYAGPDDESTGMPTFVLDVRPALDNPTNALDRVNHWWTYQGKPIWDKAMGRK